MKFVKAKLKLLHQTDLSKEIQKGLATRTYIKELEHPVNPIEISQLQTPSDVILYVSGILSDVQEMLNVRYLTRERKKEISDELNEAKYYLGVLLKYFQSQQ